MVLWLCVLNDVFAPFLGHASGGIHPRLPRECAWGPGQALLKRSRDRECSVFLSCFFVAAACVGSAVWRDDAPPLGFLGESARRVGLAILPSVTLFLCIENLVMARDPSAGSHGGVARNK